jgi:hypothetical protein
MPTIHIPAARIRQDALLLYATALKVRDLVSENFYNVETLDPADPDDKGYQRLLNIARAKKLADYIIQGQDSHDAFLPTSVFLATDKSISFDEHNHTIEFDTSLIGPFSVVDGPASTRGLKNGCTKRCAGTGF